MITKELVDKVILEIKNELSGFSIDKKNLERFDKFNSLDNEYLSYVNGVGGNYIKFLAILTKKNIVELGNREGLSTLAIYDQLSSEANFTTIDIIKDVRYCPPQMFNDKRVRFVYGDVCDVEVFSKIPIGIDFLFSDTIHYDYQIRDEFSIYKHLLADTALVAIDDIHINDKGKFWDEITYPKWDLSELCHTNGWGLFLYNRADTESDEARQRKAAEAAAKVWFRHTNELSRSLEKINRRSILSITKTIVKKIPGVYYLFCKINNRLNLIKLSTHIYK